MSIIRPRQRAITARFPHSGNRRFLVPNNATPSAIEIEAQTGFTTGRNGIGYDGIVVASNDLGQIWRKETNGAWGQVADIGAASLPVYFQNTAGRLFLASNGTNTILSSDDDGSTWQTRHTFIQEDGRLTNYFPVMSEDSNGDLWASKYPAVNSGVQQFEHILKSTDGGDSWNDLTADLAYLPSRHAHGVVFDPYTGRVWWSGGDAGDNPVQYSEDFGQTFTVLPDPVIQATTFLPTPFGLFAAADAGADRNIWRIDADLSHRIVCFTSPLVGVPEDPIAAGFAWNCAYDGKNIWFAYGKGANVLSANIIASGDLGRTWFIARDLVGTEARLAHEWGQSNYAGWDGYNYGHGNSASGAVTPFSKWRFV